MASAGVGHILATPVPDTAADYDPGYDSTWLTAPTGARDIEAYQQQPPAPTAPVGLPAPFEVPPRAFPEQAGTSATTPSRYRLSPRLPMVSRQASLLQA